MKIYQAFKNNPYLLHIFILSMMMGISARHALANVSHSITIACPGTKIPKTPQDLLRAKDDGQTWSFILTPATGVTISDQKWTINGEQINTTKETNNEKKTNAPDWGTFAGGDGTNELDWLSDPKAGSFTIGVSAKRHCTGGGVGAGGEVDDDFTISWGGTVVKFEYHAKSESGIPHGDMSLTNFVPKDFTKNKEGIRVPRGQSLTLRASWSDIDYRGPVDSPESDWESVPGTGTYTVTATTTGNGISFDKNIMKPSQTFPVDMAVGLFGNIDPGNIYVYVTDAWDEQPFDVVLSITDSGKVPKGSLGVPQDTDTSDTASLTKHFIKAQYIPKHLMTLSPPLSQLREGVNNIIPADSPRVTFWYKGEPGSPPGDDDPGPDATRPFYKNVAVDESFGTFSPTFTLDDLTKAWKDANSPNSAEDAYVKIFGRILINTSFTLHTEIKNGTTYPDVFIDPHGLMPSNSQLAAFTPAALSSNVIGFKVDQTYSSDHYKIGSFNIKITYNAATQQQTIYKVRTAN